MTVVYEWRGEFDNAEVNAPQAEAFDHRILDDDWCGQVHPAQSRVGLRSVRWTPLGFINVAWDGGVHAILLDTIVSANSRRTGIGSGLVAAAVAEAGRSGCEWLHVDFEEHLRGFHFDACGFEPTVRG
jgi:GNAT superfamily N-acetyltransferase